MMGIGRGWDRNEGRKRKDTEYFPPPWVHQCVWENFTTVLPHATRHSPGASGASYDSVPSCLMVLDTALGVQAPPMTVPSCLMLLDIALGV